MAKRKPEKMGIKDAVEEAAAKYPPRPAPKVGSGRKPTVDYERIGKLHVSIPMDIFDRLDQALLITRKKRRPDRVDKGLIIEEALTLWFKKNGC